MCCFYLSCRSCLFVWTHSGFLLTPSSRFAFSGIFPIVYLRRLSLTFEFLGFIVFCILSTASCTDNTTVLLFSSICFIAWSTAAATLPTFFMSFLHFLQPLNFFSSSLIVFGFGCNMYCLESRVIILLFSVLCLPRPCGG